MTLSWKELASKDLDAKALHNNPVAYQKFFWDLMERAEQELDFDVHGSRLTVETQTDPEGNVVITITKNEGEQELRAPLDRLINELFQKSNEKNIKMEQAVKRNTEAQYDTFRFDDFEALIGFAKSAKDGCNFVNKLYCLDDAYYLVIKSTAKTQKTADRLFDIAMEFNGYPLESCLWLPLLEERGKKIIKAKAIQVLAEKFT